MKQAIEQAPCSFDGVQRVCFCLEVEAAKKGYGMFQRAITSRGTNLDTRSGSGPFGVWQVDRLVPTAFHRVNVRENDGANAARI